MKLNELFEVSSSEYNDESGTAHRHLTTICRASKGLMQTIDKDENLPEWVQEKIANAEYMLVAAWDYLQSQQDRGINPTVNEMFDLIENMVEEAALQHGVDSDLIWTDFETVSDQELFEAAAWTRKEGQNKSGGLNKKGVASYRKEHPGSKLQTAVTTKPSKLKKDSKAYKRRKSFCARMSGVDGPMKDEKGRPTRKALALKKWNC
jgi:hypothetical protein